MAGCNKKENNKQPQTYTVTVTSTDGGTAIAEPAKASENESIILTASPNDGFLFGKWTVVKGDVKLEDTSSNPVTFKMPAKDVEITAEFEEDIDVFTKITDDAFLESCLPFDTNGDGKLSLEEAQEVKQITIYSKQIASLAGIEYFTSLETLECNGNPFTSLDVSKNTALTILFCSECGLKTLDISKNTELKEFSCSNNQLTTLDLSSNTKLTDADCSSNKLTSMDISKNTALMWFSCYDNRMSALDATGMAVDEDGKYTLRCGQQKTAGGASQTLTLTLREDMEDHWNANLKNSPYNGDGVILAE